MIRRRLKRAPAPCLVESHHGVVALGSGETDGGSVGVGVGDGVGVAVGVGDGVAVGAWVGLGVSVGLAGGGAGPGMMMGAGAKLGPVGIDGGAWMLGDAVGVARGVARRVAVGVEVTSADAALDGPAARTPPRPWDGLGTLELTQEPSQADAPMTTTTLVTPTAASPSPTWAARGMAPIPDGCLARRGGRG